MRVLSSLLFLALSVSVAQGQSSYVASGGAALLDQPAGEELGRVAVTTEVEVLEQSNGFSRVRFGGFVDLAGSAPGTVYTNESDGIDMFVSSDPTVLNLPEGAVGWTPVALEGWVDDSRLIDDLTPLFADAAKTYQRYCSACHAGYAGPVQDLIRRLKPHEWPSVANRMRPGTGISDEDFNLILHWLQTESREAWQDR